MSNESGGVLAANAREGFRSETLARFALSAFGPAVAVEVEDDHGIDLVCATSQRVGRRLHVGPGYAVQVKSDDCGEVVYSGPHVQAWLENLGSPLMICRVEKASTRIRLYSTWSLARVFLRLATDGVASEKFRLVMDQRVTVDEPSPDEVPLGAPIVDFKVTDLHDSEQTTHLRRCIEEWVQMDTENIVRRRSGLAIAKGYTQWKTNTPPSEYNEWYKPYFYSERTAGQARRIIAECATLIALVADSEEKAKLALYVATHCDLTTMGSWARDRLGV